MALDSLHDQFKDPMQGCFGIQGRVREVFRHVYKSMEAHEVLVNKHLHPDFDDSKYESEIYIPNMEIAKKLKDHLNSLEWL